MLQLSAEGKIKYKKKFLKEADKETIERICIEYAAKQLDETNGQLADILVAQFSEMMEQLELVRNKTELEKDLTKNELVRKDIKKIVGYITPFVPYIGLISGGITVGGHVISKKTGGTEQSEATEGTVGSEGTERSEATTGFERSEATEGTVGFEVE